jgi:Tol biopolymer transport system component
VTVVSRTALVLGLVAMLFAVPSSAALPGSGKIAFARDGDGIYTISPDGSDLTLFRAGSFSSPRWSPDGLRVANTGPPGTSGLAVANADGSGVHVIATTGSVALSKQPWSPDGTRIAWGPERDGDVYTASADGGDVRRISYDGLHKEPPSWSPTGSQLVYASTVTPGSEQDWELFVARDDGTPPVQITSGGSGLVVNAQPTWSPTGGSIAFLRKLASGNLGIYVIHPDGTEQHRVVDIASNSLGEPVWSPDGSQSPIRTLSMADTRGSGLLARRYSSSTPTARPYSDDGVAPKLINDGLPLVSGRRPDPDQRGSLTTMNRDGV